MTLPYFSADSLKKSTASNIIYSICKITLFFLYSIFWGGEIKIFLLTPHNFIIKKTSDKKRILVQISPFCNEKVFNLLTALEKAGVLKEGYIAYDDEQEAKVKEIFDEYL